MFTHLKVLELASVLAGPSVGQFFAELGAEVIKVENVLTGGDITRTWKSSGENTDDRSAYFCSVNWGKKSIALDLTSDEAKIAVRKLAAKSDIIIASYKPGDANKLGVSYEQLSASNQKLIYGQITGYGSHIDRVGYDAVIQAESGFMDLNGEKNGPPIKMPVALMDVLAAHHLKEGLLLALLNRERTGKGDLVEVSLIDSAISSLMNQAGNWLIAGNLPTRQGSAHPNIAPYGEIFQTQDGKMFMLAIGSDRQFLDLCEILEIEKEDVVEKYDSNQKRVKSRSALSNLLIPKFINRSASELLEQIHKRKIPAGIILNVKEALEKFGVPEILLGADNLKGIRNFAGRFPLSSSKISSNILPPPHFGEHSNEILEKI